MSLLNDIKQRILAFLIAEDEAGNALLGPESDIPAAGNPHYTISQRIAEMRERGSKIGCIGCRLLTWMFKPFYWDIKGYDHCTEAMQDMPESLPTDG